MTWIRLAIPAVATLVSVGVPVQAAAQETGGAAAQETAVLNVGKSATLGTYLTDQKGRAVYLFMADKGQKASTCYDACAKAWPPVLTKMKPKAGAPGLKSDLIGMIERKDGSQQVTYGGWPLYYFIKDKGEGQTTGQDVKGFGAEWYLVSPGGEPVHGKH